MRGGIIAALAVVGVVAIVLWAAARAKRRDAARVAGTAFAAPLNAAERGLQAARFTTMAGQNGSGWQAPDGPRRSLYMVGPLK